MIVRDRLLRMVYFTKVFSLEKLGCGTLWRIRPLLAEMRQGVAQRSAGDLHHSLERRVHRQD
jgi:uncharacterized membrane protein